MSRSQEILRIAERLALVEEQVAQVEAERSETVRMLAYCLYDICERKDRAAEAQVWNTLAREWPALEAVAAGLGEVGREGVLPLEMPGGA